MTYNQWCS